MRFKTCSALLYRTKDGTKQVKNWKILPYQLTAFIYNPSIGKKKIIPPQKLL